jgi:predicted lipoprotein with Yx(FWY)xxD motif
VRRALVAGSVGVLLVAACAAPEQPSADRSSAGSQGPVRSGGAATDVSPAPTSTASPAGPTRPPSSSDAQGAGRVVVVGDSDYGPMLYDGRRQAIYLFDEERSPRPRCYGECAAAWPPVLTDGSPRAGRGTDAALLGTVRRRGGASQVTYAGHPLYYYAHESPGQVLCHDIEDFGGLWLVVTPQGRAAPSTR